MIHFPVPADEEARLRELLALSPGDGQASAEMEAIVALACSICDAPTALLSLIDKDTQRILAKVGFRGRTVPRHHAFCNLTVFGNQPFFVTDAAQDQRFVDNPFVADGVRFYAGVPLRGPSGQPVGALCVIDTSAREITEQQIGQLQNLATLAEVLLRQDSDARRLADLSRTVLADGEQLRAQARELDVMHRMLEDASVLGEMGAFDYDMRTGRTRWSDSMKRIHEIEGDIQSTNDFSHLKQFYSRKDLAQYVRAVRHAMETRQTVDIEASIRTAKGAKRWVRVRVGFEYENGEPVRRFGIMQDVSRQKRMVDRLDYLANRDPLTGLYNRNYFLRQADQFLAAHPDRLRGVAILDLDGFKSINDSYGHGAGDACLKVVAARLREYCNNTSILVRPGGDEFTIVFARNGDSDDTLARFEGLRQAVGQPIEWKGLTFQVSVSIGLALWDGGRKAMTAMELVQQADLAVYKAKASGRNCVASYSSDLHRTALKRFNLISRARQAIERREFVLFYQPKVRLSDQKLVGFEALIRWRQDDGNFKTPGHFLAALEDPEMSRRIGAFVIEAAVEQARAWRAIDFDFGHIAINVSSSQFAGRSFVDDLMARMDAACLAPTDIQVEVTEGVLLSTSGTVDVALRRLSERGIKVAFDDFGTGYASLVHLRQFEIDIIKLDMSFIQSMLTSQADMAIVQTVLLLAERLGKTVVAEGVETDMQMEMLRVNGCQFAQGYLFSPPVHPDAVLAQWGGNTRQAG
ncbi:putative bifunctional diguanylate cyclase/phosphodiesterase [Pararhizobium haloflavum]|uniref:putative bifunctional diguanylate cyclase/phosphodiesterase n=1 Tax=Pararhizobium haloflavum TaxID=2037914 RepID=UPI000C196A45|nr:EAL domain-containing protein [Pararhizobium haloflavum]